MSILDDIADRLAQEALVIADATNNDSFTDDVAKIIGASSATMEEAFLTSVRVRRAEKRAMELMAQRCLQPYA